MTLYRSKTQRQRSAADGAQYVGLIIGMLICTLYSLFIGDHILITLLLAFIGAVIGAAVGMACYMVFRS